MSSLDIEITRHPGADLLDDAVITRAAGLPVAALCDAMGRTGGSRDLHLRGSRRTVSMAGTALTVETWADDNLPVLMALAEPSQERVLVVQTIGERTSAIVGELLTRLAHTRGFAGIVVDGAVRDVAALEGLPIPVYSRSVNANGPHKRGSGSIHGRVVVGGVYVADGDLIVGDADGVVVVPRSRIDETLTEAETIVRTEEAVRSSIERETWDPLATLAAGSHLLAHPLVDGQ